MLVFPIQLLLLLRRSTSEEDQQIAEKDTSDLQLQGIRCPLCKWRPTRSSRWMCSESIYPENFLGGCGTVWNTFETHGRCPGCSHQWIWTDCLSCQRPSPHEDWYERDS